MLSGQCTETKRVFEYVYVASQVYSYWKTLVVYPPWYVNKMNT